MVDLRELEPNRTPITYPAIVNAVILASDGGLCRAAVRLTAAQIAIESGLASCFNFNISGIKARPNNGRTCWQYFSTTERFNAAQLKVAIAAAGAAGAPAPKVVGEVDGLTKVVLYPKHPYCCFRAFQSLDDAMADHLCTIREDFAPAWDALLHDPTPKAYAEGLRHGRRGAYYTATLADYTAGLAYRLRELATKVTDSDVVWGDLQ
jgi:hypothetical protein